MKNCEPLVSGPELAIERIPGAVVGQVVVKLVVELVPRAAPTGFHRVTALEHEVVDHPVEDVPLVQRVAANLAAFGVGPGVGVAGGVGVGGGVVTGQSEKVLDGLRRALGEQLDDDVAVVGV
jgi:hypothetical protein